MPNWKKLIVSGSDATLNNLNVSNAVTASFFKGDGSGLTNVTTTIAEIASKPDTFSNTTSKVITHNFNSKDVVVSVFDSTDNIIIPESIVTTDDNNVTITFAENTTGRAVVARGGHIVSGTVDYNQLSNVPSNLISSSNQLASDISGSFTATSASLASAIANSTSDYTELSNIPGGIISSSQQLPSNIVSSSIQLGSDISGSFTTTSASLAAAIAAVSTDFSDINNKPTLISSSNQLASDISGSFTSTSASLASAIANFTSDYTELSNIPGGILSSSAQLTDQNINLGTGHLSASNIQIEGFIRHTGDNNTFISMSDDHMSFTAGNQKFIEYHEAYDGDGNDDRLIINPDKGASLDFYLYGDNNSSVPFRTEGSSNRIWIRYDDDDSGNASKQINKFESSYYEGVNIRTNVLLDNSNKLYFKHGLLKDSNTSANIFFHRVDSSISNNEVLGGIVFAGDDSDAPISGSTGFAIQAEATANWTSGSYPAKLIFYSGEKGHENWPDQGIFRIDPDGKTNIGAKDTPQEMLWVSGSIESYVKGSHVSASRVIGESITGSLDYSNIDNLPTLVSSSNQLASDISGSFTATSASFATTIGNLTSDYTELTNIPGGIVSSSTQLASDISGSITATSASLAGGRLKNTTDTLTGDLTVTGTINATKLNTTIVSSSITFTSGSNIFGDEVTDKHEFTGSIDLTGPITASFLKGDGSALTNLTLSSGIISSSKQLPSGIISSSQQLPSNIVSSSAQLSEFSGSFSGSFEGDGSNLTGINATVAENTTIVDSFSSATSKTVTHNFDTKNVIVQVFDSNDQMLLPSQITTTNNNQVTVNLAESTSGRVVVAKGGHIVSASSLVTSSHALQANSASVAISSSYALTASYAENAGGGAGFPFSGSAVITGSLAVRNGTISGSFIGDGSNLTGISSNSSVVESATFTADFSNAATASFNHGFGTKNVIVQTYFSGSDTLFFADSITTTSPNIVDVTFSSPTSGRVVIAKGGHLISSSLDGGLPGITGSGFTSALSHSINHGFSTKEVVVSVYDSADNLFMPANVKTTTTSSVDITFSSPRTGRAVVSKGGHIVTSTTALNASFATEAGGLTAAGNRQSIETITTATTASLFATHLLRGSVSMSLPVGQAGDWLKVSNRMTSSYAHLVPGGSQNIMGDSGSLEVDSNNAGFELIYADSTDGWIIIGN